MQTRSIIVSLPKLFADCLVDEEFDNVESASALRWKFDMAGDIFVPEHTMSEEFDDADIEF